MKHDTLALAETDSEQQVRIRSLGSSGPPLSKAPSPDRRFLSSPGAGVVVAVALLLASFLLPYLNTGFTTNDDMNNALLSHRTFVEWAKLQGRFYFMSLHGLTARGAHAGDNLLVTNVFSLLVIATNVIFFGWLVRRLTGNTAVTWLSLLVWAALHRDNWEHYLITSSPLIYTVPLSLLFLSLIACDYGVERNSKRWLFASAVLYALTLHYSEVFFTLAPCFLVVLYRHPAATWRALSFHAAFLLVTALFYVGWRFAYPSQYDGNVLGENFRFKNFLRALWTYSVSSFPVYLYSPPDEIRRFSTFRGTSLNVFHGLPILITWLQNFCHFEPAWLLRAALAAGAAWVLLRRVAVRLSLPAWALLGAFIACLMFLPNVPHALTSKYQQWVCRENAHFYVGSYFSFFGICLLLGALVCHLTALARANWLRAALAGLFATVVFTETLRVSAWNSAEVASKVYARRKWDLMESFLSSASFRDIPPNSIIYAPSLMTRGYSIAAGYPAYWGEYIRYRMGKDLLVLTDRKAIAASLNERLDPPARRYYLKYSLNRDWTETCLAFAPIVDVQMVEDQDWGIYRNAETVEVDDSIRVVGDDVVVFFHSTKDQRLVRFLLFQDRTGARAVEVPTPPNTKEFKSHLRGDGIRLHSLFSVNNRDALYFESLRVDFGEGFPEAIKQNETDRWAWASKGNATLQLFNQTGHPAKVELSFQLVDWAGIKSVVVIHAGDTCLRLSPPPQGSRLPVVLPLIVPPQGMAVRFRYEPNATDQISRDGSCDTFGVFNPAIRRLFVSPHP